MMLRVILFIVIVADVTFLVSANLAACRLHLDAVARDHLHTHNTIALAVLILTTSGFLITLLRKSAARPGSNWPAEPPGES